jgi:hypothetical protein
MSLTDLSSLPPVASSAHARTARRAMPPWTDWLPGYRKLLEAAWSLQTIHHRFVPAPGQEAMPSRGQCGVTAAWLMEVPD